MPQVPLGARVFPATAFFDLECSNLNADFGRVLLAVVYACPSEDQPAGTWHTFRGDNYPEWKRGRRSNDAPLVRDIIECLAGFDILIAHNGVRFDRPFLNARAARHGVPLLNPRSKIVDPCLLARRYLRLHSNALDNVVAHLGIENLKTRIRGDVWMHAALDGSKEAMDEIEDHCRRDVLMMVQIVAKLRGLIGAIDPFGSY